MEAAAAEAAMHVGGRGADGVAEGEENRTSKRKVRKQLLDEQVAKSRSTWLHPSGKDEKTVPFHRIHALLYLTGLSQAFICRVTLVNAATLSHYLRCINKRSRQDLFEDKLHLFVNKYLDGKYDDDVRRAHPELTL